MIVVSWLSGNHTRSHSHGSTVTDRCAVSTATILSGALHITPRVKNHHSPRLSHRPKRIVCIAPSLPTIFYARFIAHGGRAYSHNCIMRIMCVRNLGPDMCLEEYRGYQPLIEFPDGEHFEQDRITQYVTTLVSERKQTLR